MENPVVPPAPMRSPERWLAFLRIAVGIWFAKAIFTKLSITLAWGFLPLPTASDRWLHVMPLLVTKYAEGNPVGFFRDFLLNTVVPNSHMYAQLTAFGEAAVGLGLVFGCCTPLAADVGRGRVGAGPPARLVAGARAARLGNVQQVVRPLAHRDGRNHLAAP